MPEVAMDAIRAPGEMTDYERYVSVSKHALTIKIFSVLAFVRRTVYYIILTILRSSLLFLCSCFNTGASSRLFSSTRSASTLRTHIASSFHYW